MAGLFSGSAADLLKQYGKAVPDTQPMSSLEEAQAAKAKLEAEAVCTDEGCTQDHTHGHSHGHGETCTEDHSHGHEHEDKNESAHSRGQAHAACGEAHDQGGHDHAACSGDHGHVHGHAEEHPVATALRANVAGASHVEVLAEGSGCGQKLKIVIVATAFEGLPMLKQHRLVNAAAKDELAKVHAFNVKTYTPAKWAAANK